MITIQEAGPEDFGTISAIAYKTWPVTYGPILSEKQLTYMLDLFYSTDGLRKNITDGHRFILAKEGEIVLGFASYVHDYPEMHTTRIPKIYMLPESQGKGIGKMLVDCIQAKARKSGSGKLSLNVNRFNKARGFYEKLGFVIAAQEDIQIGNGYLMEDYVMEKLLR